MMSCCLQNWDAQAFPFGDGGYIDNQGLYAFLRRKVQKIVLYYSCPMNGTIDEWSANNSGLSLPFGACADCYSSLGINTTAFNGATKIFAEGKAGFQKLYEKYQANMAAGRVNVYEARLNVIENKFVGVPGGWQVDVMFVMNAPIAAWERNLPADTRAELKKAREGEELFQSCVDGRLWVCCGYAVQEEWVAAVPSSPIF